MEQPIINIIVAAGSGSRFGATLAPRFGVDGEDRRFCRWRCACTAGRCQDLADGSFCALCRMVDILDHGPRFRAVRRGSDTRDLGVSQPLARQISVLEIALKPIPLCP